MQGQISAAAVVYAKDIERVSRFYTEVAELAVIHAAPDYVSLRSRGFELVVVAVPTRIAEQIQIEVPPKQRDNTALKLCLFVTSLAHARARAAELGGALNPDAREWTFQGDRVCDGHDPEGNVIQLRERGHPQAES